MRLKYLLMRLNLRKRQVLHNLEHWAKGIRGQMTAQGYELKGLGQANLPAEQGEAGEVRMGNTRQSQPWAPSTLWRSTKVNLGAETAKKLSTL